MLFMLNTLTHRHLQFVTPSSQTFFLFSFKNTLWIMYFTVSLLLKYNPFNKHSLSCIIFKAICFKSRNLRFSYWNRVWVLVTQLCPTLCDPMDYSPPHSFVHGKNTAVGCHFLLQGIFPTQESNPGLLHCSQILYCLSHQGSYFSIFLPHKLGVSCQAN